MYFIKYYVYQENVKKHRNREYANDSTVTTMNETNTGASFRYNSSGGISGIVIYTNAKIEGTNNPVTTMAHREYYDEDERIPSFSTFNLGRIQDGIYGTNSYYTNGEIVAASSGYVFPTINELTTYLQLDDSEKDNYARLHSNNYNNVQMGISNWDIYVTNLDFLNRLKKQSIFTIRVDNKKITNDNLNDYDINIYGGFRYSDSMGGDNYVIKKIGSYGITNNLNISVEQVINFVDDMPESKVYDIGDYWIGFSLSYNGMTSAIMGGEFNIKYNKIGISGLVPIEGNSSDGSTITFHWDKSPTTDIDYSNNEDVVADGETPNSLYRVYDTGTRTYFCTQTQITNLITELWSGDFINKISSLNQSPIENIISLKFLPFSLGVSETTIRIGNYTSKVSALTGLPDTFRVELGTIRIRPHYNNYLDLSPYTRMYIWLPYAGLMPLNQNDIIDKDLRLNLYYALDGQAKYTLEKTGCVINSWDCNIATDVPLSATNSAQANLQKLTSLNIFQPLQAIQGFLTTPEHTGIKGSLSANVFSLMTHSIEVFYDRPQFQESVGFNHAKGRTCNLTKFIGELQGFTKCYNDIDLTGLSCDKEEKEMIRDILTSGFYV